jgi:hypothetical protein
MSTSDTRRRLRDYEAAVRSQRRLGPIFNAANDAVEQALGKTSLAELVRDVG